MKDILYFSAKWCGPCKTMRPLVTDVAIKSKVNLKIIDIDEDNDSAIRFNISQVPTFIKIVNGQEVARMFGAHTKYELEKFISAY